MHIDYTPKVLYMTPNQVFLTTGVITEIAKVLNEKVKYLIKFV